MADIGGTPFLLSPATGRAATPSSAVSDVEATGAGAHHRAGKAPAPADAGAAFVLESKGTWWHAGFHLTTAIVGPTVLTLPYALRGMGWGLGLAALTLVFAVTFYAYFLVSRVLDHCEARGRRHIRFRELAADVLGTRPAHATHGDRPPSVVHRMPLLPEILSSGCPLTCTCVQLDQLTEMLVIANGVVDLWFCFSSRIWVGVLPGGERANRDQRRRYHREHLACRRLPKDNVLEPGTARPSEAVPFHHHRRRGAGLPLAAAVVPLAAAHQPRLADPQLRLHHPCVSCLHSSRCVEQCSSEGLLVELVQVREDLQRIPFHLHPRIRFRQRHSARDPGHAGAAGGREDDEGAGSVLRGDLLHVLLPGHHRLLGVRQPGAVQLAAEPHARRGPLPRPDVAARPHRRPRPPPAPRHRPGVLAGGVRDHGEELGGRGARAVLAAEHGAAGGAADGVRGGVRVRGGDAALLRRHRRCGGRRGVHPARLRAPRRDVQHGTGAAQALARVPGQRGHHGCLHLRRGHRGRRVRAEARDGRTQV